jgi:hypothetical protein
MMGPCFGTLNIRGFPITGHCFGTSTNSRISILGRYSSRDLNYIRISMFWDIISFLGEKVTWANETKNLIYF